MVQNLFDVIKKRHSVRKYLKYQITEIEINNIKSFINKLSQIKNKKIDWVVDTNCSSGSGMIYGNITENDFENFTEYGFQGEQIILFLTSIGFSTCWMANKNSSPAVILFGKEAKNSIQNKIMNMILSKKELSTFVVDTKNIITENQKNILTYSCIAPSAYNKRAWKYLIIDESTIIIKPDETKSSNFLYLDLGITLSHCYLTAKEFYKNPEIIVGENQFTLKLK